MSWLAWLRLAFEQRDFSELVKVCRGVRPGQWSSFARALSAHESEKSKGDEIPGKLQRQPLDQIDVETAQIEDLIQMRTRNELLPYRRYLYVGETSVDAGTRERFSRTVSCIPSRVNGRHGRATADDVGGIYQG